jgi:hypothetical protein
LVSGRWSVMFQVTGTMVLCQEGGCYSGDNWSRGDGPSRVSIVPVGMAWRLYRVLYYDMTMWRCDDATMRRCDDVMMSRCDDARIQRWINTTTETIGICGDVRMLGSNDATIQTSKGTMMRSRNGCVKCHSVLLHFNQLLFCCNLWCLPTTHVDFVPR